MDNTTLTWLLIGALVYLISQVMKLQESLKFTHGRALTAESHLSAAYQVIASKDQELTRRDQAIKDKDEMIWSLVKRRGQEGGDV